MAIRKWTRILAASLLLALALNSGGHAQSLNVGDKAPAFALPSSTGKEIRLADFAGKKTVILFFYIGAFTEP